MYSVLIPVDTDEERALSQARFVASLPSATEEVKATLLFVFHEGIGDEVPENLKSYKSGTRISSVRRALEYLEKEKIETDVVDDSGKTVSDIIQEAEELDADLVVLGGRKRSPAAKVIFGSVTQSVLLNCSRPVVVTGRQHGGQE